jgi:hypothetical protein
LQATFRTVAGEPIDKPDSAESIFKDRYETVLYFTVTRSTTTHYKYVSIPLAWKSRKMDRPLSTGYEQGRSVTETDPV